MQPITPAEAAVSKMTGYQLEAIRKINDVLTGPHPETPIPLAAMDGLGDDPSLADGVVDAFRRAGWLVEWRLGQQWAIFTPPSRPSRSYAVETCVGTPTADPTTRADAPNPAESWRIEQAVMDVLETDAKHVVMGDRRVIAEAVRKRLVGEKTHAANPFNPAPLPNVIAKAFAEDRAKAFAEHRGNVATPKTRGQEVAIECIYQHSPARVSFAHGDHGFCFPISEGTTEIAIYHLRETLAHVIDSERAAAAVEEREACAKVADDVAANSQQASQFGDRGYGRGAVSAANTVAFWIRKRGEAKS